MEVSGFELASVFISCNVLERVMIQVDDSSLQEAGPFPLVYFDDTSKAFVFVGGYLPPTGTYPIGVQAILQEADSFKVSSFTFDLIVDSDSYFTNCAEQVAEDEAQEAEPLCLQSSVQLTGAKDNYSFTCTSGSLSMQTISFSDTVGGACLDSFDYEFTPSKESIEENRFVQASKQLFVYTDRVDLEVFTNVLSIRRANGEILKTLTFTYTVKVPESLKQEEPDESSTSTSDATTGQNIPSVL